MCLTCRSLSVADADWMSRVSVVVFVVVGDIVEDGEEKRYINTKAEIVKNTYTYVMEVPDQCKNVFLRHSEESLRTGLPSNTIWASFPNFSLSASETSRCHLLGTGTS